ncbi:MAG: DUF420 domain-containing protein [Rhodospirillaceae bacterium]
MQHILHMDMDIPHLLPHVTASLNALTAVLLLIAYVMIRSGKRDAHRKFMISAVIVSALFLACYLVYHVTAPIFVFRGQGAVRGIYYALLISHVVLAVVILPMIFVTIRRALTGCFDLHRRIARWTFPLWMYVSVSGFVVYLLLYHIYA